MGIYWVHLRRARVGAMSRVRRAISPPPDAVPWLCSVSPVPRSSCHLSPVIDDWPRSVTTRAETPRDRSSGGPRFLSPVTIHQPGGPVVNRIRRFAGGREGHHLTTTSATTGYLPRTATGRS